MKKAYDKLQFFLIFTFVSLLSVTLGTNIMAATLLQTNVGHVNFSIGSLSQFHLNILRAGGGLNRAKQKRIFVFVYRARKNEKLSRVAKRYKVKVSDLIIINGMVSPYRLRAGQRIKIPWRGQKIPKYDRKRVSFRGNKRKKTSKKVTKYKNQTKLRSTSRGKISSDRLGLEFTSRNADNQTELLAPKPSVIRKKWDLNWMWPASGYLSKHYTQQHKAVEIKGKYGQSVYAAAKGKVVYTGSTTFSFGSLVIIKHRNSLFTTYAHNSRLLVKLGEAVNVGQKIAEMGQNNLQSNLLRFEVRLKGKAINPLNFLPNVKKNLIY